MNTQETKKTENSEIEAAESMQEKEIKTEENIEVNQASKELEACKQEVNNWKEKYIRAQADLDNFQKRVEKERFTWMSNAQAKVFTELLNVVDNFDRAFADKSDQSEDVQGFAIIYKSLQKILDSFGVKKMDNYQAFDPNFHEALVQVESDEHESGQIVQVLQHGYMFKDHVLRPAKVSVAK